MPTNTAAWLGVKHAKLEVTSAPYTPPREDEIVIKNHAVAINPVDWMKQVIQLAVAAGYEVITTSSPRNFDYVKKLGASQAFDYNSTTVVEDVIEAFKGKTIAGALAIRSGSAEACLDVVHACNGNKFVSMASSPVSFEKLPQRPGMSLQLPLLVLQLLSFNVSMRVKSRMRNIRTKFIFGSSLMDNEVSKVIYVDFLPKALADGRYVAAPDPYVVGKGLEYVQTGFDAQMKGVSAKKVVVSL